MRARRQPPRRHRIHGITVIEYAVAGALLVVTVVFAFMQLGIALGISIDQIAAALQGDAAANAGRAPASGGDAPSGGGGGKP